MKLSRKMRITVAGLLALVATCAVVLKRLRSMTPYEAIRLAGRYISDECPTCQNGDFQGQAQWIEDPGLWAVTLSRTTIEDGIAVKQSAPFPVGVRPDGVCEFVTWSIIPVEPPGKADASATRFKYGGPYPLRIDSRFMADQDSPPGDPCRLLSQFIPNRANRISAQQAVTIINKSRRHPFFADRPRITQAYWLPEQGYWVFLYPHTEADGSTQFDAHPIVLNRYGEPVSVKVGLVAFDDVDYNNVDIIRRIVIDGKTYLIGEPN
jgi:hypothetical protein